MITTEAKPGAVLFLGYTGEHLARRIRFSTADWAEAYGDGAAALVHRRRGDETPYTVLLEQEEDGAVWTVRREDAAIAGPGECELQYLVGERVAKRERWITRVAQSMSDPGAYPDDPGQGYLEQVAAAGAAAQQAARQAAASAGEAKEAAERIEEPPRIGENGNWFIGAEDSGVSATGPQGEKGDKGDKGDPGETGPQGEQGPQGLAGADGQDGSDGQPGADGQDGYTPVKGTDYWTQADRAAMVEDVLAALPAAEEVSV